MAESGIVAKILQTARERGAKLVSEAGGQRERKLQEGRTRIAAEREARREALGKREREASRQELSAFRLVERNATLKLKRELLDALYETVWQRMLQPDTFRKWAEQRILSYCKPGDTLIVASGQSDQFSRDLKSVLDAHKLTVSPEKGAFRAGFVVSRGSIRLNCTLDEEMKTAIRDAEIEVARVLFG